MDRGTNNPRNQCQVCWPECMVMMGKLYRLAAFLNDATRVRSASTGDEISPSHQTRGVLISASVFGSGCLRTGVCGIVSSTDSGTRAIPAPEATHAMMA